MKRLPLLLTFLVCAAVLLPAQEHWAFKGTVVKMKMSDCLPEGGFRAAMSGTAMLRKSCPQYTVLSSRVVYVLLGRHQSEFMPLAEDVPFTIHKNEALFFGGKEKVQSRFVVQQMMLRSEWERRQQLRESEQGKLERSVGYEVPQRRPSPMAASFP